MQQFPNKIKINIDIYKKKWINTIRTIGTGDIMKYEL